MHWPVLPIFALCLTVAPQALADHKICIGQYKNNCPSPPIDGYYPCPNEQDKVAEQICTLHKDGGVVKLGYQIIQVETKEAKGGCNYEVFRVICQKEDAK